MWIKVTVSKSALFCTFLLVLFVFLALLQLKLEFKSWLRVCILPHPLSVVIALERERKPQMGLTWVSEQLLPAAPTRPEALCGGTLP